MCDLLLSVTGEETIDTSVKVNEKRAFFRWLAGVNERQPGDKQKLDCCLKTVLESNYR